MAHDVPGTPYGKEFSPICSMGIFPDEESASEWFERWIWPEGRHCPRCGCLKTTVASATSCLPYYCPSCRKQFSVRIGTALERSKVPLRKWAIAIHMEATSQEGVSSMRLHRDLKVTQKTAWFMQQRIREAMTCEGRVLPSDPVEADGTQMGGRERNTLRAGRGPVGETSVAGAKDRATNGIRAEVADTEDTETLSGFLERHSKNDARTCTDGICAWVGTDRGHETVNHSVGAYVREQIRTQGWDSFWADMRCAQRGVYQKMSAKHLHRYVRQFASRHDMREADTFDRMAAIVAGMVGRRLMYRDLIADNGLPSGARSGTDAGSVT